MNFYYTTHRKITVTYELQKCKNHTGDTQTRTQPYNITHLQLTHAYIYTESCVMCLKRIFKVQKG